MAVTISGVVTEKEYGEPTYRTKVMPLGSDGSVIGNNVGAVTDFEGKYTLVIPDELVSSVKQIAYRPLDPTHNTKKVDFKPNLTSYSQDVVLDWTTSVSQQQAVYVDVWTNKTKCRNSGGVWVDKDGKLNEGNQIGQCWSKQRYNCVKSGGKWDLKTKKCKKGLSTLQAVLLGLGLVVVFFGARHIYLKNKG